VKIQTCHNYYIWDKLDEKGFLKYKYPQHVFYIDIIR
jgi:hypothetical protein